MRSRYITTPIYYVNGDPHIGHAHTSIMGDILKRSWQMLGRDVFYSTGTDEHGQKNQEAITGSGLDADAYLSRQSLRFRQLFDRLNVSYDFFMRTTFEKHKIVVSRVLEDIYRKGLIYKTDYTGNYCVGCEQFKKATDLDEAGRCPDHLTKPVRQTETNYFFRLSPFQEWLKSYIRSDAGLIQPDFYASEVLAMLEEPLEDLCISRPRKRVWLGIELPFDRDYVTYVWFDALLNYISNIGYGENPDFDKWWSCSVHLMAKDIIKTHIIYWPIMLKAAGLNPPFQYRIHGYWVGEGGQKMSKTLGNVVEPNEMVDLAGVDGLRFYLAKSMGGTDAQISPSLITACYNTDLANNIGNLHSRIVKFIKKQCDYRVPDPASIHPDDAAVTAFSAQQAQAALDRIDLAFVPDLIATALRIADRLNLHFNDMEPWKLIRDPSATERLESVLFSALDGLRILFELLSPVIPKSASAGLKSIGVQPPAPGSEKHRFEPGRLIRKVPLTQTPDLFPRIEK